MVTSAPTNGVSFQGKMPDEHFEFYFRQHWIRLVKPFLITLATSIALFSIGVSLLGPDTDPSTRHALLFFITVFFLFIHFYFLAHLYHYFLRVVIVTNKKIHRIKRTLLLAFNEQRNIDILNLLNIEKSQRGLFQNIFGFGTLRLETRESQMRLHFVPRISQCYDALMHLHLQERERAAAMRDQVLQVKT